MQETGCKKCIQGYIDGITKGGIQDAVCGFLCVMMCDHLCEKGMLMATNLSIDPQLLDEALAISGHKTKRETVNQALTEFVQRRKQREIIELFGKLPPDKDYNYKKGRRHK
jgi:Arc/MetJ family transcription regulator